MAAEKITHSDVGFPIGNDASKIGTGVRWGIYEVDSTENGDWVVIDEFSDIKFVDAQIGSDNIWTATPVTIESGSKIVLHEGGSDTHRLFVIGE